MKLIVDSKNEPVVFTQQLTNDLYSAQALLKAGRVIDAHETLTMILNRFNWHSYYGQSSFGNRAIESMYQVVRQEMESSNQV